MRSGLTAAVRIIYLTSQGIAYPTSPTLPQLSAAQLSTTLPKNYFRTLVLCTAFLLRFFVLNARVAPQEQETARNYVAIAQRFLHSGSEDPQDERGRGAALFEVLSRQVPRDLEDDGLKVDDRLGASLVYDAVARGQALRCQRVDMEEDEDGDGEGGGEVKVEDSGFGDEGVSAGDTWETDGGGLQMDGLGALDFSLPQDIWGDSIWGIFGDLAPAQLPAYPPPDTGHEQNFAYR